MILVSPQRIPAKAASEYWTTISAVEQGDGYKCFYNPAYPQRNARQSPTWTCSPHPCAF